MPIYDVQCAKCSSTSELLLLHSITDELKCPKCGSTEVEKLISATSSITGKSSFSVPSSGSTCCGSTPNRLNCEGPGSCCGGSLK